MADVRDGYKAYVAKLFTLAGMSDPQARADRVFALEMKIAEAQTDIITSAGRAQGRTIRGSAPTSRRRRRGSTGTRFWTAAGLPRQQDFIVWNPADDHQARRRWSRASRWQSWQDWLAFHQINRITSVLPKAFDQASFDFFGKQLSGTAAPRPRDKRAIGAVNGALGYAVGKIYAARIFPGLVEGGDPARW